jgi:hypothetical protein
VCTSGTCVPCTDGQIMCNRQCVDPQSDDTYCGASASCQPDAGTAGTVCTPPAVCTNGTCK